MLICIVFPFYIKKPKEWKLITIFNSLNLPLQVKEDEWKDFQEEERKDYTGLKIGQLQIKEDDQYSGTDGDGDGENEDGSENPDKRKAGPWKKVSGSNATAEVPSAPKEPPPQQSEKANPSKVYVSPALRNQQVQQQLLKPINLRKGALPDLANEEYFPTLGAARPEELRRKKNEPAFEEVKHGGRFQRSSDLPTNAPVAIGNRYNSLSDS